MPNLSITARLFLLLMVFGLIFYGTLVNVFLHIQKMMNISEEIGSINTKISTQSKVLVEKLQEMDIFVKRFSHTKSSLDHDQFAVAQLAFNSSLQSINRLAVRGYTLPPVLTLFTEEYSSFTEGSGQQELAIGSDIPWINDTTLHRWLGMLNQLRDINQANIENSLMQIHNLTRKATRNGLFGLVLSIFISSLGIWYITRSMLIPLRQMSRDLRAIPHGGQPPEITVGAAHEFQDLAIAFNEMHTELREQESLRADFIAALSHEIRTPLSSIQESVNMLLEKLLGEINPKQEKFLRIAAQELARINGLLNQLMDVSSLVAPRQEPKIARMIDPRQVVLNCIAALSATAAQKSITIRERCQPNCGVIQGRAEELQQVLVNILGNAIKFSPAGGEIIVWLEKDSQRDHMVFHISDQGPGIPENEHGLIFKKYYRSQLVRKHMNGVGLGLYISTRIMHDMGGDIGVANNPDGGCTFSVSIPSA